MCLYQIYCHVTVMSSWTIAVVAVVIAAEFVVAGMDWTHLILFRFQQFPQKHQPLPSSFPPGPIIFP